MQKLCNESTFKHYTRLFKSRKTPWSLQNTLTITMLEDTWGLLLLTWLSNYIHHNMQDDIACPFLEDTWGPLLLTWLSNHMPNKVWDGITYPVILDLFLRTRTVKSSGSYCGGWWIRHPIWRTELGVSTTHRSRARSSLHTTLRDIFCSQQLHPQTPVFGDYHFSSPFDQIYIIA